MKNSITDKEIQETILSFIRDEKVEDEVVFEKLNILIESFQFYPMIVKKDKNKSTSIYYIMNANKTADHTVRNIYFKVL